MPPFGFDPSMLDIRLLNTVTGMTYAIKDFISTLSMCEQFEDSNAKTRYSRRVASRQKLYVKLKALGRRL